jgi:hypothetical protein
VTQTRHSFVVTVHEDGRVAVVEDVQTGARARVDDLTRVGAQIEAWLVSGSRRTSPPTAAPAPGRCE